MLNAYKMIHFEFEPQKPYLYLMKHMDKLRLDGHLINGTNMMRLDKNQNVRVWCVFASIKTHRQCVSSRPDMLIFEALKQKPFVLTSSLECVTYLIIKTHN